MSSIDERIVNMRFNGQQFQAGIKGAQIALGLLKKNMNLDGATKSLEGLDAAGKKFSLDGISNGVQAIGAKFTALGIVGITALTNIANKAINAGQTILKSLTIDPVMDGFREYELKMGSIQTILANTSRHGTELPEVTSELEKLNLYADKTIYNFGDMTRNIGLFTNAGIKIGDATSMIKGFSNEAAASGTTAEGASGAAYQLSQALSAGTIRLQDWKSLTNVGMGNKNMQSGLIEMATAMGTFEGTTMTAEEATRDFNGSLEKEWLSADVMSSYLKVMAEDTYEAAKATALANGISEEQADIMAKQAVTANEAATKVRTWTQLIGTLQEGVGSGWGQTFETLIGDFEQATEMWSAVNDALGPIIDASSKARNDMLDEWASLGGRDNLLMILSNAFTLLMNPINKVIEAFKEIFPPMTGKRLAEITSLVLDFVETLGPGPEKLENIKRTAKGLFAVLDIGWMIIKGVIGVLWDLLGSFKGAGGGVLEFTGGIGDFLVAVRDAIKNGEGLTKFFDGLSKVIKAPLGFVISITSAIMAFVSALMNLGPGQGPSTAIDKIKGRLEPLVNLGRFLSDVWKGFVNVIKRVVDFFAPLGGIISNVVKTVSDAIKKAVDTMDFSGVMDVMNIGLLGGIGILIKKLIDLLKGGGGLGGGFLDTIKESFEGLTGTLGAMQAQLKSKALMNIAIAVALLTASVVALSFIDSARLAKALGAMSLMFTQLSYSMGVFMKMASGPGIAQLPVLAAGLVLLSLAILLLTASVAILAALDWNDLAKGLLGVTVLIKGLITAAKGMTGLGPGMAASGLGLMLLAIAIRVLVSSVTKLSGMSWEDLAKGLAGVAVLLATLAGFTHIMANPAGIIKTAISIAILGGALHILVGAIQKFAGMSWLDLAKGMSAMAVALATIAGALHIMPKTAIVSAAALVVVAKALEILYPTLEKFGAMDWISIGKAGTMLAGTLLIIAGAMALMTTAAFGAVGLIIVAKALEIISAPLIAFGQMDWIEIAKAGTMLAGTLLIIAGAMALMTTAVFGAAGLIIVAQALAILGPVLLSFGKMSWDEIIRGLTMLAGVFAVVGLAGLLLTPLIPTLLGLGIAIMLIGAGTALAGLGILALSAGIAALAISGVAGAAALVAVVTAVVSLIPMVIGALGEALILVAKMIGETAPAVVEAMVVLVTAILKGIIALVPMIGETLVSVITMLLDTIVDLAPKIAKTFLVLVTAIITILKGAIPQIVDVLVLLVTEILEGLGVLVPAVVALLVSIVSSFLAAIVTLTPQVIAVFVALISSLLQAIITLTPQIVQVFVTMIMSLLDAVKTLVPEFNATFVVLVMSLLLTINTLAPAIVKTLVNLLHLLVETVVEEVPYMVDAGMRLILGILNGISNKLPDIIDAGADIIIKFVDGIGKNMTKISKAATDTILTFVEELSVTINNNTERMRTAGGDLAWALINGMTGGLLGGAKDVADRAWEMGKKAINSIKEAIDSNSPSKETEKLGNYLGDGLALGMNNSGNTVGKSAGGMANVALNALKTGMSKVSDVINSDVDMTPVIRPVLDLTEIQRGVGALDGMVANKELNIDSAYNNASAIIANQKSAPITVNGDGTSTQGDRITLIQNNTSPKALSQVEIYRQTKNQLSTLKEALKI